MKKGRFIALLVWGLALALNGFSQSFITNGLVAYFPFNGNANDMSGNELNGTVSGAVLTTNRFGTANSAYYFNGSSAYITLPLGSAAFSGDFTASAWFNAYDLTNGWAAIFAEQGSSLRTEIPGDRCGCAGPGDLISYSSFAPATFGWFLDYHARTPTNSFCQVAVTKLGTAVSMYLNGQLVTAGQVTDPTLVSGDNLKIGRQDDEDIPGDTAFHGVIDDIRIYNRALSAFEIQQLYAYESQSFVALKKAVKPTFSNLYLGTNYQLQVSSDLNTWTNVDSPFTPTNANQDYPRYFDVSSWEQLFFRLQTSP